MQTNPLFLNVLVGEAVYVCVCVPALSCSIALSRMSDDSFGFNEKFINSHYAYSHTYAYVNISGLYSAFLSLQYVLLQVNS